MKKLFKYTLLAALAGMSLSAMADDVKLFSFTIPETGVGEAVTMELMSNDGQSVKVDWGNGELSEPIVLANESVDYAATEINGTAAGTTVSVYGPNLTGLTKAYLNCRVDAKTKKTAVTFETLPSLKYISLGYNNLTSLDVSCLPALETLDTPDNKLTDLVLAAKGAKQENLKSINVSNSYNVATGKLNAAGGDNQLLTNDWSVAPNLETLNVCGNTKLGWFGSFDTSANTNLKTLNINCCALGNYDISHLTSLATLNAQWNGMTGTYDVSTMVPVSANVFLGHNNLTGVKYPVSDAGKMLRLNIINNDFTFDLLPAPGMTASANNYVYSPQNDLQVVLDPKANTLDLKKYLVTVDGKETTVSFAAKGADDSALTLAEGTDYTVADGVYTFLAPVKDLVALLKNEAFPQLTLNTVAATSLALLPETFSFEIPEAGQAFYSWYEMSVYLAEEGGYFVDYGDGDFVPAACKYDSYNERNYFYLEGETKGTKVTVKGNPANVTGIDYSASNYSENPVKISSINVSALVNMTQLTLGNCLLENIDLSKNEKLTNLSLCSNKLTAFDQALPNLVQLNLSNANSADKLAYGENKISTFDYSKFPALTNLNLSFTGYQMDWSKAGQLTSITMDGNDLTSADFSACPEVTSLYLRWNKLSVLDLSPITTEVQCYAIMNNIEEIKLPAQKTGNLYIANNKLTFATLPALDKVGEYTNYAPQQPMAVTTAAGVVDLSSQAKVGDVETVYVWTVPAAEADAEPVVFDKYVVNNGVFSFTEAAQGAVCKMTNAAFEKLTLETVALDVEKSGAAVEELGATAGEAEYYNLQGVRVLNPTEGLYIRVSGGKASKVLVRK